MKKSSSAYSKSSRPFGPDLIAPEIDVREEFGMRRSLRRGATAHAINMNVAAHIIEAVYRWRSERNSDVPGLNMICVYARLDALKPTILSYSFSF